jgi:hypothetical protein
VTGELDKVIMTKLASLLPVKELAYKFLNDAADSTLEFESEDNFLNWLNDLTREFIACEQKKPDRHTDRIFVPAQKICLSMGEADRVYRISMAGLVAMIRAAPRPPIDASEAERIEARYGVEVV